MSVITRTKVEIIRGGTDSDPDSKVVTVNAGEKLKIPCHFSHDRLNRVTAIRWARDGGGDVAKDPKDRVDFGADGAVTVQDVQRRHEGNYRY